MAQFKEKSTERSYLKSSNFLQKLHRREVCLQYCNQNLAIDGPRPLYPELPPRLKFPLTSLISNSVIHDGHVFVGFTNDSQYVLSYTMQIDVDLPSTIPTYCYKLYFWKFVPHKPLKKISTVKLFRGFHIYSELLIEFCQWPLDNNKLLIHGCNHVTGSDHRVNQYPCYITIAGVPSVLPCDECNASGVGVCPDEDEDDLTRQTKCLQHAFVLHLEYNLVSPFPSFDPRISLKKNSTVVINTGDTLIALSISTDFRYVKTSICNTTTAQETSMKISWSSQDDRICCTQCTLNNQLDNSPDSVSSSHQLCPPGVGAETVSSPSSSNVELFNSPFRKSRYRWQIQRLELNDDEKCEVSSETIKSQETPDISVRSSELNEFSDHASDVSLSSPSFKTAKQTLKFCRSTESLETYAMSQFEDSAKHTKNIYIESFKENVFPSSDMWTQGSRSCPTSSRRSSDIIGSRHWFDSDTNSSSSLPQQPECISTITQVFLPHLEGDLAETGDEDVGNSFYHSSLALEVYWPTTRRLPPRSMTALENTNGPSLVVKQNVFDLEPFVNETAEWLCFQTGKIYQAFTDYDVRIVDVSETGDVSALVMILVQASPKNKSNSKNNSCSDGPERNLYESAYLFVWNILTGMYKVLDTCMLREIEMLKGKAVIPRPWNPGKRKCALLQSKWLLPCSPMHDVHVLNNEPAIRGASLDELYSPDRDVVIIRPKQLMP